MDDICRLCCARSFVRNYIFDEETALHLKMSLYMPIKVVRNDQLPQKICDRCSCKVNDLYQFCNEAIEVQNRLRNALISKGVILEDGTVKHHLSQDPASLNPVSLSLCQQSTQTEPHPTELDLKVKVKIEPHDSPPPFVKPEDNHIDPDVCDPPTAQSDDSDNLSLLTLKKKKKKKEKKIFLNGDINKKTKVKESKNKKKSKKLNNWEELLANLPKGQTGETGANIRCEEVKSEDDSSGLEDLFEIQSKKVKEEPESYNCCICFVKCYSRGDMLQHYKEHGSDMDMSAEPPAPPPPPPDQNPLRCPRCSKIMSAEQWSEHWRGHWARDRRPFRCARCERAFRNPHQILKHGLSVECAGAGAGAGGQSAPPEKRFICDLCPEEFVYMRYLLCHRARAHPEAAGEAPRLRCAVCGAQFAHVNSLRRHLRAHSGARDHLCSVCGKALSSREHLKFHLRIHSGYKPNVCKTCGKGFVKKCNLTLHERTHSGEKPHVCAHCSKAFSQRSTLVIHERYHSGARPYVCSLCGRGFVAKGLLSMHLKTTCI